MISNKQPVIAFIGAGNMASSLIGGLIAHGWDPHCIWATHPKNETLIRLKQDFGIHVTHNNDEGASQADIVFFSVKPGVLKTIATELAFTIKKKNPLIVSIATGKRTKDIKQWLGNHDHLAIVRCMPNTPALISCGATALYANEFVNQKQKALVESILKAVGLTVWLEDENLLDVVTALSGSGPAYFFLIIEALNDAAEKLGLPRELAQLLTNQTALGAARMALESDKDVKELRKQVTSPGGTTERAIAELEFGRIRELLFSALKAAYTRAVDLSKED